MVDAAAATTPGDGAAPAGAEGRCASRSTVLRVHTAPPTHTSNPEVITRPVPVAADPPSEPEPELRTLQQLVDALLEPLLLGASPELAADLGLPLNETPALAGPSGAANAAELLLPAVAQEGSASQSGQAWAAEEPMEEGSPSRPPQPAHHRPLLVQASMSLLHRMGQHQHLELDAMAQLAAAEAASTAAAAGSPGGERTGLARSNSDAHQLQEVLNGGSEMIARANQASSAWRSMAHAGSPAPAPAQAWHGSHRRGLPTVQEGGEPQGAARSGVPGPLALPLQGRGRAPGERAEPSPRRVQRKSILGQQPSIPGGGGAAGAAGGASRRGSLALPGVAGAATRRWEAKQEAELAEVLRQGALGDPEIQEYLVRELRHRLRARGSGAGGAERPEGGGAAAGGEEEDDERLDPIVQVRAGQRGGRLCCGSPHAPAVASCCLLAAARPGLSCTQAWSSPTWGGDGKCTSCPNPPQIPCGPPTQAWLVTKVPAPKVEGHAPPPSRTACRLIAAQEMQK